MEGIHRIKREFQQTPITLAISLITLSVVLFGSPFAKGSWLNPTIPKVVITAETIQPNETDYPGKYLISLWSKNLEKVPAMVTANVLLLDSKGKQIQILNETEPEKKTILELEPGTEINFGLTTDKIPAFISVCLDSEAEGFRAQSRFEGRYYLPNPANEVTLIKNYSRAQGNIFSDRRRTACS